MQEVAKGSLYSLNHTAVTQSKRVALLTQADDEIKRETAMIFIEIGYVSNRHYIGTLVYGLSKPSS